MGAVKISFVGAVVREGVPKHNQVFKNDFIFFKGASSSNSIQ
jgi:hypothetical protein